MHKYTKTRPNTIYSNFLNNILSMYKGVRPGGVKGQLGHQVLKFEKYQIFLK